MKPQELLTIDELSAALKCQPATINQLTDANIIPVIMVGALRRFNLADCLKALQTQGNGSKAGGAA